MMCARCMSECVSAAFLIGRDGHMHGVCDKCMNEMSSDLIRELESSDRAIWAEDREPEYDPGLIEEGL